MADVRVRRSGKDRDGDITSLCGTGWSVTKSQAVREINTGTNRYYVAEATPSVWVQVRTRGQVQYLTTEADGISPNNLGRLPNC